MSEEHNAPTFRTPEEVAPQLGMSPGELRRYCRESGHCTRLGRNRIMLHQSDIENLVEWLRHQREAKGRWWASTSDQDD